MEPSLIYLLFSSMFLGLIGLLGAFIEWCDRGNVQAKIDKEIKETVNDLNEKKAFKFVRIGRMEAPFDPKMHRCGTEEIGFEGFEIGDVIACSHPQCEKQFILGWFLSSKLYANDALVNSSKLKRWVDFKDYESNPGEYVYSK